MNALDRTIRRGYGRSSRRYSSDLTDREWQYMRPFMPEPCRLGRRRKTDLPEVVKRDPQQAAIGGCCRTTEVARFV